MNMLFVGDFLRVQIRDIQPTKTTTPYTYAPAAHPPIYGRKLSDLLDIAFTTFYSNLPRTDNIC
jgi:hypothetical protein